LIALSHNEAPIVAEEPVFATAQTIRARHQARVPKLDAFPVCRRTKD
jgi:hypothetical protein